MAKIIVVGGGFAGLSASVFLSDKGHNVKLIEASPKLGGRAYSFDYNIYDTTVDNGQHIMMGCYLFTLEFLELIKSTDKIEIQPYLNIDFVARDKKKYQLSTEGVTYPFNILSALKNYDALTNLEKFQVVKLFLKIAVCNPLHYNNISTKEFLAIHHQSQNSIDTLWDIIHVGTMNCKLNESSAEIFLRILKEIFFTVDESTRIVLPKTGLSEIYIDQSAKFLTERNSSISLSEKLISINFDNDSSIARSILTNQNAYNDFDYLFIAIPPHQLEKILKESNIKFELPFYEYSSILNVHLWLDQNPFTQSFYGLINSKIHWLFNHGKHITLTTSSADELIELNDEEIIDIIKKELTEYFSEFQTVRIIDKLIIKEKRATFKPTIDNCNQRKKIPHNIGNIHFVGDWTNTGFPATIEGAVKSSAISVDILSENLK
ncbi:MAG: hydroxysqualene dehydroxylase HpnE [Melioribacteraceae bacterium]|nr:hydroxysqualene dehydroxylase HpnE [Melioribacteraceae bacterium]